MFSLNVVEFLYLLLVKKGDSNMNEYLVENFSLD